MTAKTTRLLVLVGIILTDATITWNLWRNSERFGAPPYIEEYETPKKPNTSQDFPNWVRPEGPIKIGLQAGHWKRSEMPDELSRIRDNGGGTSSKQGISEWEVVLVIAEETKILLEKEGYVVDILPATVPPSYWADAFVSIHADGNLNPLVSGYKIAASARDATGKANDLSQLIENRYGENLKFEIDPNISRNMTRYYAFNWRRYEHAIHPMTPGVIVETGFLTNPAEASQLINNPKLPAKGIAEGIKDFINLQKETGLL